MKKLLLLLCFVGLIISAFPLVSNADGFIEKEGELTVGQEMAKILATQIGRGQRCMIRIKMT